MTCLLSDPIESLIADRTCEQFAEACDVLIVGSGYGGAIAAAQLAGDGHKVVLFERGNEYAPGDFPESLGELPGHVRIQRNDRNALTGRAEGLFDIHIGDPLSVLVGNGLGGGSLINANVALQPQDPVLLSNQWPGALRDDLQTLKSSYAAVRTLLGVNASSFGGNPKYRALDRLAVSLGAQCHAAPITVAQADGLNNVGVTQKKCIGCGNCVTGCNVGAKNTLAMNALPLAKSKGGRLYTGATVLSVAAAGNADGSDGWRVRFRRTALTKSVLRKEVFTLRAKVVILAAGSLGSTEILLKSNTPAKIFSDKLGAHFSTNGDMIAAGFAQKHPVHAVAHADLSQDWDARAPRDIGPTITGYFQTAVQSDTEGYDKQVTVEDGAIPSALAHIFGEMVTTAHLPKRQIDYDLPAWFGDNPHSDPLGMQPGAIGHSQVLLVMGDDQAQYQLGLRNDDDDPADLDNAVVCLLPPRNNGDGGLPPPVLPPVFNAIDRLLKRGEKAGGFDGGDYLPNPLWKLMPDALAQVSNAPAPDGKLLTVHPLGGCVMADSRDGGVVDHYGRVFRNEAPDKTAVFHGLYVMDGAIVPRALGVNPFLTIAALAHRNAAQVARYLQWQPGTVSGAVCDAIRDQLAANLPAAAPASVPVPAHKVDAKLDELLCGRLDIDVAPDWLVASLGAEAQKLCAEKGFVLTVSTRMDDVLQWLRQPNLPLNATAKLAWNDVDTDTVAVEHLHVIAEGAGQVRFLAWDKPNASQINDRAWDALWAFVTRRGGELFDGITGGGDFWKQFKAFRTVAKNHANWRYLSYDLTLGKGATQLRLTGKKELAYAPAKRNPWQALTELPITLAGHSGQSRVTGLITVDLVGFSRHSPFQIVQAPNSPVAIMSMVSVGTMMLRVLFQSHFWSFGVTDYPKEKLLPDPVNGKTPDIRKPGPLRLGMFDWNKVYPQVHDLPVLAAADSTEKIKLRLVRYQPASAPRGPILLVHGQALSSMVFTTNTIHVNFAEHLYNEGYDVWLVDFRLSVALPDAEEGKWLAARQWTIDQIAEHDIPAAVKFIYDNTGGKPIQVFAHCIGAAATEMAILSGKCNDASNGQSMISALAVHAVHPWLLPSVANRLRGNLAAFFKDAITWKTLDPIPPNAHTATALDAIIDRIAGSLPVADEEAEGHTATNERQGKQICSRMTLFYGYEWRHGNLDPRTHKDLLSLFGITNLEVFRHNFFVIQRQRLTNRAGANVYVREQNFAQHWQFPTLFAHGAQNLVYSSDGAARSYGRLRALREHANPDSAHDTYWFEVPGYGHMDFLFGSNAHIEVYPYIDTFFRKAAGTLDETDADWATALQRIQQVPDRDKRDPHWQPPLLPDCGPAIGWARRDDHAVTVRLWLEPDSMAASMPIGISVTPPAVTAVEVMRLQDEDYPGWYWVYDLTIPDGVDDAIEITLRYREGAVRNISLTGNAPAAAQPDPGDHRNHSDLGDSGRATAAAPLTSLPWFQRLRGGNHDQRCAFLVGSCRYPGSPFERDLADAAFAGMSAHLLDHPDRADCPGVDHVLLVGDQIYADATVDAFDTRELREVFARRYREAFKAPHMKKLLASVPVYMAVDDHEFEDNWQGNAAHLAADDKMAHDYMERFRHGIAAVRAYQWSMTRRDGTPAAPATTVAKDDNGLWHTFDSAGLPFFVMDTRTERTLRGASVTRESATLVCKRQLRALCDWLSAADPEKPKFVVCSSVLAPVHRGAVAHPSLWRNNDGWAGFPATWRALVKHIVTKNIQKVVFVSGDYHISMLAELTLRVGDQSVVAYQLVSSGLYAPLPFANDDATEYEWGKSTELPWSDTEAALEFKPYLLSTAPSQFMRVDARRDTHGWTIAAGVCGADGAIRQPEQAAGQPFVTSSGGTVGWRL
jgi:cholesterol oxidase